LKKKRKVSAATLARLRAMRKKYGLGEFKRGRRKVKSTGSRRYKAVRRRKFKNPIKTMTVLGGGLG